MFEQNKKWMSLLAICSSVVLYGESSSSIASAMSKTSEDSHFKPNGSMGPKLASNNPAIDDYGVHIEIGALVEQIRISNTDFCAHHGGQGVDPSGSTPSNPFRYDNMKRLQFNLEPGLRVALGYNTDYDGWKVNALFEWLPSVGSVVLPSLDRSAGEGEYLAVRYPEIFYSPADPSNAESVLFGEASDHMEIDYYLFEVMLSRGSYLSKKVSFEPYMGVKATWIYYNQTTKFWDDNSDGDVTMPAGTSWLIREFTDVWGVGPMIGSDVNFFLGSGFSIFGCGNFAVLFGNSHLNYYNGFVTTETIPGETKVIDSDDLVSLTIRGIFGLQFDREITHSKNHIRFRAGFDSRLYMEQYPVVNFIGKSKSPVNTFFNSGPIVEESGDFSMIGLLLDLAIDF